MSALICDICGGNLVMDETGEFAKCESCGMKHSKDRVKAKVQEIKGVVEITKGEAEKERLIKNAETYLRLKDLDGAKKVYEQITGNYPEDWRGWFGLAKIEFMKLPLDKEETVNAFSGNPILIRQYYEKCSILNSSAIMEFNRLKTEYEERCIEHKNKKINEVRKAFESEQLLFYKLGIKCSESWQGAPKQCERFELVKEECSDIFQLLSQNANFILKNLETQKHKLNNLLKLIDTVDFALGHKDEQGKFVIGCGDSGEVRRKENLINHYDSWSDYRGTLRKITDIIYLSSLEAIIEGEFKRDLYSQESELPYYNYMYISFKQKYSLEDLLDELLKPTEEEQSIIWKNLGLCEKCGSHSNDNGICTKCEYIVNKTIFNQKYNEIVKLCNKFPDKVALFREIHYKYDKDKKYSKLLRIWNPNVDSGIRIECSVNVTSKTEMHCNSQIFINLETERGWRNEKLTQMIPANQISELINYLKQRKVSKVCQYCGGKFKIAYNEYANFPFYKKCSKCGISKDY